MSHILGVQLLNALLLRVYLEIALSKPDIPVSGFFDVQLIPLVS